MDRRVILVLIFVLGVVIAIPTTWMPTVLEVTISNDGVGVDYNQTAVDEILHSSDAGPAVSATETPVSTNTEYTSTTTEPITTATPELDRATKAEQLIHVRVNAVREERGLSTLGYSSVLAEIAEAHSGDMAEYDYFSHTNQQGLDAGDRYDRHGVGCAAGENIFRYSATWITPEDLAQRAVDAWMDSPGHRENILRSRFDREGIGVVYGDDWVYVTQNFC